MATSPLRPSVAGLSLDAVRSALGLAATSGDGADTPTVTGVSLDSRAVQPGDLYAALPGFNVHGARFAASAVAAGATAVLTDPEGAALLADVSVPVLVVDEPRAALGGLSALVYGRPSDALTMVGITGTNGKTTTAHLLEAALRSAGHQIGLIGTVETRIGPDRIESERTTPESTDVHALLGVMRERGIDSCVMEVSSHALDLHRVDGVVYDVGVFTNLSQDHLDFHETMEAYFRAKASLFTPERSRAGVVCIDDEWGRRLAGQAGVPITTVSSDPAVPADWRIETGESDEFRLISADSATTLDLVSYLPGTFNVINTALAAVTLLTLGEPVPAVVAAMAMPPNVPGRMEVIHPGGVDAPRCIVDFAHTPDAIDAALTALRPSTTGRLIVIVGAGGDRDRGKRPAMGAAAARHADVVVITDDNPRSEDPATIRDAVAQGARDLVASGSARATEVVDGGGRGSAITNTIARVMLDRLEREAEGVATESVVDPDVDPIVDTVVVLGKGHETGQEIAGQKHHFDDRESVREALAAAGLVVSS